MNRMMFNHSCLRSHLGRINIVENLLCVCLGDYKTIDHAMWSCERQDSERWQLWNDLRIEVQRRRGKNSQHIKKTASGQASKFKILAEFKVA
jgi:hypothetical protein